ncbi:fused (3R)-hydroxyacyl-ACP dehydratase subunits HadA/HadB [Nocardia bovistercoris]|uniref:MaoC family dehydratase N-terminal domain-containing protein n=1 Tax=Nocardia bovistercoris TaxID=2785916 RepID=A0A931N189_9NOCA|nr:fused (3R)-hydroxyacyl-ACP dehydratase subunits HadA/HadB [Nocardia bovistercoris]MBH0778115.1 MaoC family dehydratase N-terminal domain-containing protein [Nocardia bovistercoris]
MGTEITEAPDRTVSPEIAPVRRFRVRDHYVVDREKVREFARAVRNRHGAHRFEPDARKLGYESAIAPPTFSTVIGTACIRDLLDTVLTEYDRSQLLQTEQVFEIHRPILSGDSVHTELRIESIRRYRENDVIRIAFVLTDPRGEPIQTGSVTMTARRDTQIDPNLAAAAANVLARTRPSSLPPHELSTARASTFAHEPAATREAPIGREARTAYTTTAIAMEPAVPHTLPDLDALTPGLALPTVTTTITRGDLVNYAGVTGDPNPIHFSERAARAIGLPTVVAHGVFTMGLAVDHVTEWLGDPTAVRRISVRFVGFVPVGSHAPTEVTFGARVRSVDPTARTATLALTAACAGREVFGRAFVEVRLA